MIILEDTIVAVLLALGTLTHAVCQIKDSFRGPQHEGIWSKGVTTLTTTLGNLKEVVKIDFENDVALASYTDWSRKVRRIQNEVSNLLSQYENTNSSSSSSSSDFRKGLKKLHKEVDELIVEGKEILELISQPPKSYRARDITKFPTLEEPFRDILGWLERDSVKGIRIHGAVGIGKTNIMFNLVKHEKVVSKFDPVIWLTVSREGNKKNFSRDYLLFALSQKLRLNVGDTSSILEVAKKVSDKLEDKKYLLLLDDVKKDIYLQNMGIPSGKSGSKVVITTRHGHVCSSFVNQTVKVSSLTKGEAWNMFQDVVADHKLITKTNIWQLAQRVCRECYGVPLYIERVASTFKFNYDEIHWRDGLESLRTWPEKEYEGITDMYRTLKFCYNDLENDQQKRCFLYCILYPEGSDIKTDHLLECWEAEDFLGENTEEARSRGHLVLNQLKEVSLLEEGEKENHVMMHSFIRQMALYVVESDYPSCMYLVKSRRHLNWPPAVEFWRAMHGISFANDNLKELPKSPSSCTLSTLFLSKNGQLKEVSPSFFKHIVYLHTLDLSHTGIKVLPPSTTKLTKLRNLYLNGCKHLEKLPSKITKLQKLETLDIRGTGLSGIPIVVAKLTRLRRLRVSLPKSRNGNAFTQESFKYSKLGALEELFVDVDPAVSWSTTVAVENILKEVASLENLRILKVSTGSKVKDVIEVVGQLRLHISKSEAKILRSFIENQLSRKGDSWNPFPFLVLIGCEKTEEFKLPGRFGINRYIKYRNGAGGTFPVDEILAVADAFELLDHKDVKQLSNFGTMRSVEYCVVGNCAVLETIVGSAGESVLPNLEDLYLKQLPKLVSICTAPQLPPGSLSKLKILVLTGCAELNHIFPPDVINQLCLIQHLEIEQCPKIVEVIAEAEAVANLNLLPKLKKLILRDMNALTTICKIDNLEWESLEELEIYACPGLCDFPFNNNNAKKLRVFKADQGCQDVINKLANHQVKERLQKIPLSAEMSGFDLSNSSQALGEPTTIAKSEPVHPPQKALASIEEINEIARKEELKPLIRKMSSTELPHEPSIGKKSELHGEDESATANSSEQEGRTKQKLEDAISMSQQDLMEIIVSKVSIIHTLNLSHTGIKCLPEFISKLVSLRVLILRGCEHLMELRPAIGELTNLEELDLEGTEIICLPKEISKLINLRSLKFSLCGYADTFQETKRIGPIIPRKALSNLLQLNELRILVNPRGDWWNIEVKAVIDDLCSLQELGTLCLYLPTVDLLDNLIQHCMSSIYPTAQRFRFTVGHDEERFISRLPEAVVKEFHDLEKYEKGLKYINGEGMPIEIKKVLKHVDAFLLERHWSIKNLLEYGFESTNDLKIIILLECNELQTVFNAEQSKDFDGPIFGSLEYLSIHYMKNMDRIWKGPVAKGSLSNMKSLALHTCLSLTTVFTVDMIFNLLNLEELTVQDCPMIKTLVSLNSPNLIPQTFLPNLKTMLLLELPNLGCISSGLTIAPKLERLVIFYCPKLDRLSPVEISSRDLKVIKGEKLWWDSLKWYKSDMTKDERNNLSSKFIPLRKDEDLEEQFMRD